MNTFNIIFLIFNILVFINLAFYSKKNKNIESIVDEKLYKFIKRIKDLEYQLRSIKIEDEKDKIIKELEIEIYDLHQKLSKKINDEKSEF